MQAKIAFSSVISVKTGINYPGLEPGNEFWNRVRVPGSCYKSLITTTTTTTLVALEDPFPGQKTSASYFHHFSLKC